MKMKLAFELPTILFGTTATIALVQPYAVAQSTQQVEQIAKQVTVQIDGQAPGSGVIVAREGQTYYVLTAAHVVPSPDEYDVVTPDGQKYRVDFNQVKKFPDVDLALVPFTSPKSYQVVAIGSSSQLKIGVSTYVAGFPQLPSLTVPTLAVSGGKISAIATRPVGQGYTLAYENGTFAGMSGGPILDLQGQLIGVHGASQTIYTETQGVNLQLGAKDGLNLGITINTFLRLVGQLPSAPKFPAAPPEAGTAQLTASDLLLRSWEQEIAGDRKAALASLDQAIRLKPDYGSAYLQRAHLKTKPGRTRNLKEAMSDYERAAPFESDNIILYLNQGFTRSLMGDSKGAMADYERAIRLDPNDFLAYANRAYLRLKLGDPQGAIADCDQAIRLNSYAATAYTNRGVARARLRDFKGSIVDYDRAIRLNPKDAVAYTNRGTSRRNLKDSEGALKDYDAAIRLDPKYVFAYMQRGSAREDRKDFQGAITDYDQVIQIDPNHAAAYYARGSVRQNLQDYKGAVMDFDQAIRLKPDYAEAYLMRGITLTLAGERQRPIPDLRQAVKLSKQQGNEPVYQIAVKALSQFEGGSPDATRSQTSSSSQRSNSQGSTTNLAVAAPSSPQAALVYVKRGLERNQRGDRRGAVADTTEAIRLDPKLALAYLGRGLALAGLGDRQAAIADLRQAAQLAQQQRNQQVYGLAVRSLRTLGVSF
jgi:tetratricopeptide (TPR) repeat protein